MSISQKLLKIKAQRKVFLIHVLRPKSSVFEPENGYSTESKLNPITTAAGNPARVRRIRINLQNLKMHEELTSNQGESFGSILMPYHSVILFVDSLGPTLAGAQA